MRKRCTNEPCDIELSGAQRKYCSVECGVMHNNNLRGKAGQLKPIDTVQKGDKCKWCIDCDHDEFCSPEHRMLYRQFRKGFDIVMSRQKPKPTEEQIKGYRKIEYALLNRNI